jgi:BASS family bile acid:Na+ symporter
MTPALASIDRLTPHLLTAIALVAMMAQLGLVPEEHVERAEKRHRRRLLLWALGFNLLIVPLLALGVADSLGARGPVALGLLVLAASPGGRHAPLFARVSGGDIGLSVEITMFLNKLNAFVSPLLVAWMIGVGRADLHELTFILQLLVLQMVPYYGARFFAKKRPHTAYWLRRPMGWLWGTAALLLLVYLVAHHALRTVSDFGPRGFLAAFLFGVVLLILGAIAGGRDPKMRRTFAFGAATRNLALALVVADLALGDPEVQLAIFAAWVILFFVGGSAALLTRRRSIAMPQPS